jgi:heptosyltransferase-2
MAKVLIIKMGYAETLDGELGKISSLGDVLRTTVILHLFKNDFVTWLVDQKAYPLLRANKYIAQILINNANVLRQIKDRHYDTVINFEKDRDLCMLSDSITATRHYGFRFDQATGLFRWHAGSEYAFQICSDLNTKRRNKKYWQQVIMDMVGAQWQGQEYILGSQLKAKLKYDVGLNWQVGIKWPNKVWPKEYWDRLAELLDGRYTYSWQKGLNNIDEYIEWINSCSLIVTADSLGQHIALALRRKVLILYGPTNPNETYLYGLGKILLPEIDYECIPCLKNLCMQKKNCMYFITPGKVADQIGEMINEKIETKIHYG